MPNNYKFTLCSGQKDRQRGVGTSLWTDVRHATIGKLPGTNFPQSTGEFIGDFCTAVQRKVSWRILGIEITPSLKGSPRCRRDLDDVWTQFHFTPRSRPFSDLSDIENLLPTQDYTLKYPIERTTIEHVFSPFWRHPRM